MGNVDVATITNIIIHLKFKSIKLKWIKFTPQKIWSLYIFSRYRVNINICSLKSTLNNKITLIKYYNKSNYCYIFKLILFSRQINKKYSSIQFDENSQRTLKILVLIYSTSWELPNNTQNPCLGLLNIMRILEKHTKALH